MLIFANGDTEGTIGGGELEFRVSEAARRVIEKGRLERLTYEFRDPAEGDVGVCGGEMEVLVEPIKPPATVVVVGAGHVGQAVAHLAKWLGFHVIVVDDRPDFASPEIVPGADETVVASMSEISERVSLHADSYLLLTTRGVAIDVEALPVLLESPAGYIGVIGSRRRWQITAEALREHGIADELIGRVRSPMGLELNAETPEEIALSMMAEIVMLRRGGTGETMARPAVDTDQH
jgi:xanthine dehydrogenase accessory factor